MELRVEDLLSNRDWLHRLAVSIVRSSAEADELVQDALATAMANEDRTGPLRPWLRGVMRNLARLHVRQEQRRGQREQAYHDQLEPLSPSSEQLLERCRIEQRVAQAVAELEEPFRSAILQRFFAGRSAAELSRELGIPSATVRWRQRRGLELLREQLADLREPAAPAERRRSLWFPLCWFAANFPRAAPVASVAGGKLAWLMVAVAAVLLALFGSGSSTGMEPQLASAAIPRRGDVRPPLERPRPRQLPPPGHLETSRGSATGRPPTQPVPVRGAGSSATAATSTRRQEVAGGAPRRSRSQAPAPPGPRPGSGRTAGAGSSSPAPTPTPSQTSTSYPWCYRLQGLAPTPFDLRRVEEMYLLRNKEVLVGTALSALLLASAGCSFEEDDKSPSTGPISQPDQSPDDNTDPNTPQCETSTGADGSTCSTCWDSAGNQTVTCEATDPNGGGNTDPPTPQCETSTSADGSTCTTCWDSAGNQTTTCEGTDPNGGGNTDPNTPQCETSTSADGSTCSTCWDSAGNQTVTCEATDPNGGGNTDPTTPQCETSTSADSSTCTTCWDSAGNQTTTCDGTDPNGGGNTDPNTPQCETTTGSDGSTCTTCWDSAGNQTVTCEATDPTGN